MLITKDTQLDLFKRFKPSKSQKTLITITIRTSN